MLTLPTQKFTMAISELLLPPVEVPPFFLSGLLTFGQTRIGSNHALGHRADSAMLRAGTTPPSHV